MTRRLLVIDDAEDKWVLAQFFLELDGRFVVAAAADTDSDLADAQRLRPDGILLDVMMPTSLGVIGKPFDPATLGPPVTSLLVPR